MVGQRGQVSVYHGVGQAAHPTYQGQAAVLEAVHLGQAAGLKQRGHQGHIAAGKNAVGQGLVIAQMHRHPARMAYGLLLQGLLQPGLTAAQHQQLPSLRHDLVHPGQHQRQTFLLGDAANQRKQRRISLLAQPATALQGGFAQGLASHAGRRVGMVDQGVRAWAPHRLIHRIEDAGELRVPPTQQAIEATALFRCLDFAGIAGADSAQMVGIVQAGFHEGHLAMELQAVELESRRRQAEFAKHLGVKKALVGQVVHRVERAHTLSWSGPVLEAGRCQAGMPVMAVQYLRRPVAVEPMGQVCRRPAQRGKAAVVVGIGAALGILIGVAGPRVQSRRFKHVGAHRPLATGYASELA